MCLTEKVTMSPLKNDYVISTGFAFRHSKFKVASCRYPMRCINSDICTAICDFGERVSMKVLTYFRSNPAGKQLPWNTLGWLLKSLKYTACLLFCWFSIENEWRKWVSSFLKVWRPQWSFSMMLNSKRNFLGLIYMKKRKVKLKEASPMDWI